MKNLPPKVWPFHFSLHGMQMVNFTLIPPSFEKKIVPFDQIFSPGVSLFQINPMKLSEKKPLLFHHFFLLFPMHIGVNRSPTIRFPNRTSQVPNIAPICPSKQRCYETNPQYCNLGDHAVCSDILTLSLFICIHLNVVNKLQGTTV